MLDLVPVQGGEAHMGFTSPFFDFSAEIPESV